MNVVVEFLSPLDKSGIHWKQELLLTASKASVFPPNFRSFGSSQKTEIWTKGKSFLSAE